MCLDIDGIRQFAHPVSCQFIWLVLRDIKDAEYYATIALLPASLLVLLWGLYAAKRESATLMVGDMDGFV